MQQRLAVASILVLVLLAGTSAVLILQSHVSGQAQPNGGSQTTSNSSTTHTSTNSTVSSLLTSGNHTRSYGDDNGTRTINGTKDE